MTVREAALIVLYETESKNGYLNLVFADIFQRESFKKTDVAFAKELIFGVYRKKLLLDYVIRRHSSLRLKKIEPRILTLLRMGVYQIYFMDKVPDYAVVAESVSLAKKYAKGRTSGFVNAVLRGILRDLPENKQVDLSALSNDRIQYLSVKYSYPEPLTAFFVKTFGKRAETLLAAGNETPDLCVRVNSLKNTRDELKELLLQSGIQATPTPYTDCGLYLTHADEATRRALATRFTVQDQSSQLAALALSPQKGDVVLDLCAAPGGKTTHLAELMENVGKIYAFDLYEKRLMAVNDAAKRLELSIIETKPHDASILMEAFIEKADKVLLDVPCSGLGIIRRKPDIKYKENITDFAELNDMQRKILTAAKQYVKHGGVLVYSTCTLNPSENREMVEWFLTENPEFSLSPIDSPHITDPLSARAKTGMLEMFPDTDNSDGFFVCRMIRK